MGTHWIDEPLELMSVDEMYRADAAAAASGVPTLDLMEAAGAAVAERVLASGIGGPVAVLCGPGNNGGDGFVAARLLADAGRDVRLALLGARERLAGDAATNAGRWNGPVAPLSPVAIAGAAIVVDAMFGAGLARPLDGIAAAAVEAVNASHTACIAVDVPSGVNGDTGAVRGAAIRADETVTFFRRKPGHLLYPGRGLCGSVRVADIGIPPAVLADITPATAANLPALWRDRFPWPVPEGHKFARGHVVVAGGETMTGAARLASHAALRAGAGLVTIFSPPAAGAIYRSGHPGILVRDIASAATFAEALDDRRITTLVLGPGRGLGETTRGEVLAGLAAGKDCVLDADALSAFAADPPTLFAAIAGAGACVLTPHAGEFARLFGDLAELPGGRLARARAAACRAGAVVILKGPDTVIAAPDGRAAINANAPPTLATAGAGDVLAGFTAGLLAQDMPVFEAACAAVWLHGAAADAFGPGLIASDIATALPAVLRGLLPPRGATFTRSMR
jgi:NAD(P)H-hydrate epimerase